MKRTTSYLILLGVELAAAFCVPNRLNILPAFTSLRSSSDDLDFMASLKSRVEQVSDGETKLPLVVLDSMLPRQNLKIKVNNALFKELVRTRVAQEQPYFGMMGIARLSTGEQIHLNTGVRVDIGETRIENDGLNIQLRASDQLFRIVEVADAEGGWTEARVEFLDSLDDESKINEKDRIGLARAMSKARFFSGLVKEWIPLARERERQPGQIDQLLEDLGDMPPSEKPSDCAMWVGALVNPLPAMGVALEIRPSLLTAKSAEQRVEVALAGIKKSIRHMKGEPLM